MYFTIAKGDYGYMIDSISKDYQTLRNKFPDAKIYLSDDPIVSIYVIKSQLKEIYNGKN